MYYCFNPLNTKGVYIRPEMLLSNQGRLMSWAELSRVSNRI